MEKITFITLFTLIVIYSCSNDSLFNPITQNQQTNYTKVLTGENNQTKIELYSATTSYLAYGYNDLGFKVFLNNQQQSTGWVKFFPKMYHNFPNSPFHSSPTSPQFYYNSNIGMFTGYACFTMLTDTGMGWWGFFNYNDYARLDSIYFTVNSMPGAQIRTFTGQGTSGVFHITLVEPYNPIVAIQPFKCLLHKTDMDINFEEIITASMYIKPWMNMGGGHGSSNNINPVFNSVTGFYEGQVNLSMSGTWVVYDSIYYNGQWITPQFPNTPYFTFNP